MTDSPPNQTIADRYEVLRPLGRGSFGHTFLAHDREERRDVAIKMLDAQRAPDWKAFELFEREVAVLRGLRHQGVPQVFDSFQAEWGERDAAFLVMEYVDGTSLEELIETGSTHEPQEVTRLLLDLLGILEYLHARMPPILHRDIKPANIVIRPSGVPVLVDFGAVRNVFAGPNDGGSTVVGTAAYMPYEQYMGQATPSSDLYALAATFLHLITGRPPRDFLTDGGRIEVPEALPASPLKAVLTRMLEPSPSERYGSARDARMALLMHDAPTALARRDAPAPPGQRHSDVPLAHMIAPVPDLGPAPRALAGEVRDAYDRTKLSAWRLMKTSNKSERPGVGTALALGLVSLASFGIWPAIALGSAAQHRIRLRRFFKNGTPTIATILDIQVEKNSLEQKMARVSYEFEADGLLHRDSDLVLPTTGVRLRPGEHVHVLYIAERDHDSVIVRV